MSLPSIKTGIRILIVAGIADLALAIYFINSLMFPHIVFAATPSSPEVLKPGAAVELLISNIEATGLKPTSVYAMTRRYFSGSGRTITLGTDNFQAFEYETKGIASSEMSELAQRYADSTRSNEWKRNIHLYANDTIAVFYFGNNEKIIYALEQAGGLSRVTSSPLKKTLSMNK